MMNAEQNKCSFCKESKIVSRQYLHARDPQPGADSCAFIYYCSDCGLREIVTDLQES